MVSSSAANTRMYASTIHCSSLWLAPKSREMAGSATFSTVLSRLMISSDTQIKSSPNQRFWCACSWTAADGFSVRFMLDSPLFNVGYDVR